MLAEEKKIIYIRIDVRRQKMVYIRKEECNYAMIYKRTEDIYEQKIGYCKQMLGYIK